MTERLHYDIETYSEVNLKKAGVYAYAEHPSTEVLVVCFAFGKGPVNVWIPVEEADHLPAAVVAATQANLDPGATLFVQRQCPDILARAVSSERELAAHNAQFERVVLNGTAGQRIGFPRVDAKQMVCTAAKSRAHGLPGALGDVAKALGTYPKDENGKGDMLRLSKPKKPTKKDPSTRYTPCSVPEKFVRLYSYCSDDVRAERGVDDAVPDLADSERQVWVLDQKINDRGVRVDLEAIADVQSIIKEYRTELEAKCVEWTGLKPTQNGKIADWIREHGWPHLQDMQADTVNQLTERTDVPDNVKRVLRLYSTYGMKAVSKFQAMKDAVCGDLRLRGMFIYHGAGTGRWSSILVQLQNLFRPVIDDTIVAIEAFATRSLAWVRTLYG